MADLVVHESDPERRRAQPAAHEVVIAAILVGVVPLLLAAAATLGFHALIGAPDAALDLFGLFTRWPLALAAPITVVLTIAVLRVSSCALNEWTVGFACAVGALLVMGFLGWFALHGYVVVLLAASITSGYFWLVWFAGARATRYLIRTAPAVPQP